MNTKTMLYNPYNGMPRHPDDIKSDPKGLLLLESERNIRVWGWVWKDKVYDGCYIPSYTPAYPFKDGALLALVDPSDLHRPLENTDWHHPKEDVA